MGMSIVTTASTEYRLQGVHHFCWAIYHLSAKSPTQHSKSWVTGSGWLSLARMPIPPSGLRGMGEILGTFCSKVVTKLPSKSYIVETQQNQKEVLLLSSSPAKNARCLLQVALKCSSKQFYS